MEMKKILIGAPTSQRHEYVFDEWYNNCRNFSYPNKDIIVVETTNDNGAYYRKLKKYEGLIVLRYKWNPKKERLMNMLASAREIIRKYCVEHGYDYLFWLDTDTIPPQDSIERLMNYDKDQVGFLVHVYPEPFPQRPAVFHSGFVISGYGLDYYNWKEIEEWKQNAAKWQTGDANGWKPDDEKFPFLKKVYASAIGCLLVKRKVMENTKFVGHPTFVNGEDLWYYAWADDKKFEAWCDFSLRATHKNTHWDKLVVQEMEGKGKFSWNIIQGWDLGTKDVDVLEPKYDKRSVYRDIEKAGFPRK